MFNKHHDVYFALIEDNEEEEEEVRGKMFPFDKLIIPGKLKILAPRSHVKECYLLSLCTKTIFLKSIR